MKEFNYFYAFLLLFIPNVLCSQVTYNDSLLIESIIAKTDSLKKMRASLEKQISTIDSILSNLKKKKNEIEYEMVKGEKIFVNTSSNITASLREEPLLHKSNIIAKIPPNTKISVLGMANNDHLKVIYDGQVGYIVRYLTNMDDNLYNNLKDKFKLEQQKKLKDIDEAKEKIESNPLWIKSFTANIRETPSNNSKIVAKLEEGEEVYKQESSTNWIKIKFIDKNKSDKKEFSSIDDLEKNYFEGWIYHTLVSEKRIEKLSKFERIKIEERNQRKHFVNTHPNIPQKFKDAIIEAKVMVGMTKEMVIASWGKPKDINRTVSGLNVSEQWVYGLGKYLYFKNSILTSWQD